MPLVIFGVLISVKVLALARRFPAAGIPGFKFEVGIGTDLAGGARLRGEAASASD